MNIFELFIIQPIFNLLMVIYSLIPGGDFGVTIIVFTIIVRMAMYPLVKRQLHQTRMMRKLQPELKKIKKAANGDKQVEAAQMMELYKRHGVSPFRSIGILFIQLPIFIGLYYSIRIFTMQRDEIAHYLYGFVQALEPIKDIVSNPESFSEKLFGIVDLTKHAVGANGIDVILFILAILSAITQYIMSRQTMPTGNSSKRFRDIMKQAADGEQADQADINAAVTQNMTKIMPIMMFFIMVNLPGALALYYTVSNLVAVAQQSYLLRQDEEELEEIADEPGEKSKKSSSATKREKNATEAHITRIVATDKRRRK